MKKPLPAIIICLFLFSCSKEQQDESIWIRVQNQTRLQISDIKVYSVTQNGAGDIERSYGTVPAGKTSNYQAHIKAFNWPMYSLTAEGAAPVLRRQIPCENGLQTLTPGKYTLIIQELDPYESVLLTKD